MFSKMSLFVRPLKVKSRDFTFLIKGVLRKFVSQLKYFPVSLVINVLMT